MSPEDASLVAELRAKLHARRETMTPYREHRQRRRMNGATRCSIAREPIEIPLPLPQETRKAIIIEAAGRGWSRWEPETIVGGELNELEAAWYERRVSS